MRIAVIGSGYVGLVSAACFAELGHDVVSVDVDADKIEALQAGKVPIYEELLPELLDRQRDKRLHFTTSLPEAVQASAVVFIAVGTPSAEDGTADLSYVEAVARGVAQAANGYKVIVEKSTVPVYTCEWIRRIMRLGCAKADVDVVSNPEFLREGSAVTDFLLPDRIVVGADTERAAKLLRELYQPLTSGEYYRREDALVKPRQKSAPELILTTAKSAELIKHASNAFLAMKISYVNAVAAICENVGADIDGVCRGMGSDARIGPQFLAPGIGYGGSCFPKDLTAFRSIAAESGYEFRLLDEVIRINEEQVKRFVGKVHGALWNLRGKKIAALGLAFKGGTDDVRESRAIAIIRELIKEHSLVTAYDPAAMENASQALPADSIQYAGNPYEASDGADALLILTDWPQFRQLDLARLKSLLKQPIVIDGRNLFEPAQMEAAGLDYICVGRLSTLR
jgi:UDPglucose 6-dehydrogenase